MGRHCTVCDHERRDQVDADLVAGESYRRIASRFGLTEASVRRHRAHIAEAIKKAKQRHEETTTAATWDLFVKIAEIEAEYTGLIEKALKKGKLRTAIAGHREISRLLEIVHRLRDANKLSFDDFVRAQVNWVRITVAVTKEVFNASDDQVAEFATKLQDELRHAKI